MVDRSRGRALASVVALAVVFGVATAENETEAVNKCCDFGSFFDVSALRCWPLPRDREGRESSSELERSIRERSKWHGVLREKMIRCDGGSVTSFEKAESVTIEETGTLNVGDKENARAEDFCLDGTLGSSGEMKLVIVGCRKTEEYCKSRLCFRKCCPVGESYGVSERKCGKRREAFRAQFYEKGGERRWEAREFGILVGDACGEDGKYKLERDLGERGYLEKDGQLLVATGAGEKWRLSRDEFCLEVVAAETKNGFINESSTESFRCFPKTGARFENSRLQFFLLSLGFIISCLFLMATFLVYLFSRKRKNLYGKTLMCYVASLFAAYLCLAIVELKREMDNALCLYIGYSLLFSFLAAFFWLNVMSFDIWKTFKSERAVERSNAGKSKLRFLWYSAYAWSFPSAITGVCAFANHSPHFPFQSIRPDIGKELCWFSRKKKGIYVFFIAPISLMIILNIVFYVQTAWKIWKVKTTLNKMEKQLHKKFSANKQQFLINGKLFIVMGITWSLEIVSFFAPHPVWYVTDAANALHGLFIFVVFVLKKKILVEVSEKVWVPLKRIRKVGGSSPLPGEHCSRKILPPISTEPTPTTKNTKTDLQ